MAKNSSDPILEIVEALHDGIKEQSDALAKVAQRMNRMHEDVRRTVELAARLRLASDNAKGRALSHQQTLDEVEKRLAALEKRLGEGARAAKPQQRAPRSGKA